MTWFERPTTETEHQGLLVTRLRRAWFDNDNDDTSDPDWWQWWADNGQYVTGRNTR